MFKKITLFVIVLLEMFIFTMGNSTITFANENVSDFAGGDGTEENPYKIESVQHLKNIENYLNAHFLQTKDIQVDSSWKPIGEGETYAFSGTYDGDGHKIINMVGSSSSVGMELYYGMFGYNKGTIKNIIFENCFFEATSNLTSYVGIVAGGNSGKIENCQVIDNNTSNKNIKPNLSGYIGGIAGTNRGVISYCQVNSTKLTNRTCSFSRYEGGKFRIGGIVGRNERSGLVEYCANFAQISISASSSDTYLNDNGLTLNIGGIVSDNFGVVENSYNCGNINISSSSSEISFVSSVSGGISALNSGGTIKNCFNVGKLRTSLQGVYIDNYLSPSGGELSIESGGIVGRLSAAYEDFMPVYIGQIENCYNLGWIFGYTSPANYNTTPNSSVAVGGIAANTTSNGMDKCILSNCYTVGTIDGSCIVQTNISGEIKKRGDLDLGEVIGTNGAGTGKNLYYSSSSFPGVSGGISTGLGLVSRQEFKNNIFVDILNSGKGDGATWILSDKDSISQGYPTFEYMLEKVEKVNANPQNGQWFGETEVTLSCQTEGADIRYTTDGSEPSITSVQYNNPILLNQSTTIKAKAFKTGMATSETATFTYTIISKDSPAFEIESVRGRPGSEIDVTVALRNNPGIATFTLNIYFDKTKLTLIDLIQSPEFNTGSIVSNVQAGGDLTTLECVSAFWTNATNINTSGNLYTIRFKIKEDITDCNIPLTMQIGTIADQNLQDITIYSIPGKVIVSNIKPGDINGDDNINGKDAVVLAQYIAGGFGINFTQTQFETADVYPDGEVNGKDAIRMAQYLASWPVVLGKK